MADQLTGSRGVVVTAHPDGVRAGVDVLRDGGNAVDAAVAALLALCVVAPHNVNLAGYGGSMVIHLAGSRRTTAIDFDARCPLAYTRQLLANAQDAVHGYKSIGVPGIVAGADLALKRHGTRAWKDVAAHALRLAVDGWPIDREFQTALTAWAKQTDPASRHAILGDGPVPKAGERWVQKDLAALIRRLGDEGPGVFYAGDIPRTFVRQVRANGGVLSEEDFKRFRAQEVEPVAADYRGYRILTPPAPSGGLIALAALKSLEPFDTKGWQPWGAPYFDHLADALKLAWALRHAHLSDPDFVKIPVDEFTSDAAGRARAQKIREGHVDASAKPIGGPNHTVNVATVDAAGNAVSLTATQGGTFGSRVAIEGLGVIVGHGMSRFDLVAGSPNQPEPGKRMQHNMCPTVVLKDGRLDAVLGLPGGTRIPTVTAQLLVSHVDFRATPGQSVSAPRVHTEGAEPLLLSPATPTEVAAELVMMGHRVTRNQAIGGPANVATVDPRTGAVTAACTKTGGVGTL
jgi:gamma-glutamyltranspeptidase/glutathione hydrolase